MHQSRNDSVGFVTFSSTQPVNLPRISYKRAQFPALVSNQRNVSRKPVVCTVQSVPSIYSTTDVRISKTSEWKALEEHAKNVILKTHLRDLVTDAKRSEKLWAEFDGCILDYSRQRVIPETMKLLFALAKRAQLEEKKEAMFRGDKINITEDRSVLHTALRAPKGTQLYIDGMNVVDEVWQILEKIRTFSERVRNGQHVGVTGRPIKNFIAIGIGGSYLGPEFLHEALRTEKVASAAAGDRVLRFLKETLAIVVSKTFTTRETSINAKTIKDWLIYHLGDSAETIKKHMVACSTNLDKVVKFGIAPENMFPFWDWVGGRYSVCSAVGALPISLQYGFDVFERFLQGAHSMDAHFRYAPLEGNLPVLLGLLGVWNMSFLNYNARAIHPYSEALLRFPAHIQQLDMESNGKHVNIFGEAVDYPVGEIDFGEPGTNGQHSFFQLLHMGQVVPCDFIGFIESQNPVCEEGEPVSNHDELMANFFAQPDALAFGKTAEEVRQEGKSEWLTPHMVFTGNRPSSCLLMPVLDAYVTGQLLALYEHRTAVQGFLWEINSFDQFGVELGKVLANKVRKQLNESRYFNKEISGFNHSTTKLLNRYLEGSVGCAFEHVFHYEDE
ncbi:Glucose-6-phosphate isomerase, cytosolic [Galdieria sulphuraria]|nr:Glucose-6-phosphate isomerase, cytosolic [Galdieria sulphuraria]